MEFLILIFILNLMQSQGKFCEKSKTPFELGEWNGSLKHMDSATIENKPVFATEGQVYVYENTFPGYTIRYVNVDNLAQRTCGASAVLKRGGVGTSTVLIVLHAATNQEIRSVIDVWGTRDAARKNIKTILKDDGLMKDMKSRYLFKQMRAVNHNSRFITY
ncbi:uncharacterized protein [Choristoneura fumiferana]|uniref:uncharacterized protein n=1 Tax=Choristoneura fumiferana TaxID=7141 RepID=UPI003D15D1B0